MIDVLHWLTIVMSAVAAVGLGMAWRFRWAHPIVRPVIIYGFFVAVAELAFRVWARWWFDAETDLVLGRGLSFFAQFLLASVLLLFVVAIRRYERETRVPR